LGRRPASLGSRKTRVKPRVELAGSEYALLCQDGHGDRSRWQVCCVAVGDYNMPFPLCLSLPTDTSYSRRRLSGAQRCERRRPAEGPSPCGPKRSQTAAEPLLVVHRQLGAKAEEGDAGHGIECATHGPAGGYAAGSRKTGDDTEKVQQRSAAWLSSSATSAGVMGAAEELGQHSEVEDKHLEVGDVGYEPLPPARGRTDGRVFSWSNGRYRPAADLSA
jgi:hypothetical protein